MENKLIKNLNNINILVKINFNKEFKIENSKLIYLNKNTKIYHLRNFLNNNFITNSDESINLFIKNHNNYFLVNQNSTLINYEKYIDADGILNFYLTKFESYGN